MAIADAYARVTDIRQLIGALPTAAPVSAPPATEPATTTAPSFQSQLRAAAVPTATPTANATPIEATQPEPAHADGCCCCCCAGDATAPAATAPTTVSLALPAQDQSVPTGLRALSAAETQVGQAEEPPGSNDGPALGVYRSAVAGAYPGAPWCAYFVSWAAQQAGVPLGDSGQGLGSVAEIADWAQRSGRLLPQGAQPQAGDLILFGDRHVGIVESVQPDGSLETVEGNYRNQVSRVHRSPSEATGFVRL